MLVVMLYYKRVLKPWVGIGLSLVWHVPRFRPQQVLPLPRMQVFAVYVPIGAYASVGMSDPGPVVVGPQLA